LFSHLDAERVVQGVDDARIKPRPTFHFRLPNSEVHDPRFRVTDAWRAWLDVELLAGDEVRLRQLGDKALSDLGSMLAAFRRRWGFGIVNPFARGATR
jgi:hypothetical protein